MLQSNSSGNNSFWGTQASLCPSTTTATFQSNSSGNDSLWVIQTSLRPNKKTATLQSNSSGKTSSWGSQYSLSKLHASAQSSTALNSERKNSSRETKALYFTSYHVTTAML